MYSTMKSLPNTRDLLCLPSSSNFFVPRLASTLSQLSNVTGRKCGSASDGASLERTRNPVTRPQWAFLPSADKYKILIHLSFHSFFLLLEFIVIRVVPDIRPFLYPVSGFVCRISGQKIFTWYILSLKPRSPLNITVKFRKL